MTFDVIAAFATLLTPLGAMAAVVYTILTRRIKKLEALNNELMVFATETCSQKSEGMEQLARLIVKSGSEG